MYLNPADRMFCIFLPSTPSHPATEPAFNEWDNNGFAWKSFGKYERGTNCKAWLFQILFNVVRHERRNWFKWITGKEEDLAEAQLVAPAPIPDTLTDGNILAALDKLPAQFREALLLVDVEEFSYKEASEILRVPIGTIMSRLNRARGLLRNQLTDVARSYGISAGG